MNIITQKNKIHTAMLVSVLFTTIILFYGNFQFRAIFTWFPSLMIIFIATLFLIKSGKVDKIFLKVVVINSLWLVYALAFSFSVLNFNIHIKAILETFLYILIFSIIINYFIKDVKKLFKTILFSLNIFLMVSSFVFIFKITGLYDDGHSFSSLYSNRNTYAFMAVVYLIIILNLPSYISYKFKTISILMLLFFILITGSSKGLLGIIIVLVLYFLGKYSLKKIIFILPLFFILIFGSSFIFETTVIRLNKKIDAISRFENNYRADNIGHNSAKVRIFLAYDAIDIFLDNKVSGVGVNNGQFYLQIPKSFESLMVSINSQNNITEMLLNVGFPGFLLFYLPLFYLLYKSIYSNSKNREIKLMVISLVILKILMDTGMKSYNDAGHVFLLILSWSLYYRFLNNQKKQTNATKFSSKIDFKPGIIKFTNWVNTQEAKDDNYTKSIDEIKDKGLYK